MCYALRPLSYVLHPTHLFKDHHKSLGIAPNANALLLVEILRGLQLCLTHSVQNLVVAKLLEISKTWILTFVGVF